MRQPGIGGFVARLFCRIGAHNPVFTESRAIHCAECGRFLRWSGLT